MKGIASCGGSGVPARFGGPGAVTNIGFVTAPSPPDLSGTPGPPQLALPFIRHVLRESG